MSDLIIRGMEMPENCGDCYFCDEWAKCQLLNLNNIFDYCKDGIERPKTCPLVPLPEKHGRLIDAEAFNDYMQNRYDNNEITNGDWIDFRLSLKDQPTIVPAEGGGEE